MYWASLPVEIQTNILDALFLHENTARYASASLAWQSIIEKRNFARLKITQARLAGFSDIGYRHRHLVKYIWFSIEPAEFLCPKCGGLVRSTCQKVSFETVKQAVWDLVVHLSMWEPSANGLVLDVSVKYPSGLMHPSSGIQYGPSAILEQKMEKIVQCSYWLHEKKFLEMNGHLYHRAANDSEREWIHAQDPGAALLWLQNNETNVRERLREAELDFEDEFEDEIADEMEVEREPEPELVILKARAVTRLLLRRQTRHLWRPEVVAELLDLLSSVREIVYEPWREWWRME